MIGGGYLLVSGHWSNFSLIRFLGVILFDEEMFPFLLGSLSAGHPLVATDYYEDFNNYLFVSFQYSRIYKNGLGIHQCPPSAMCL